MLTPLNNQAHRELRIDIGKPFARAKHHHLVPLNAAEFVLAGADFPIVFVKDKETGRISSVALTGLKPKQNLFYQNGEWTASYAPMSIHAMPISLVEDSNNAEKLIAVVNEDSRYLSNTQGERLFTEAGEQTEFLQKQTEQAAERRLRSEQTENFTKKLLDLNLIKSNPITVNPEAEEAYELQGLYVIDENKLNELGDSALLELRQLGYLPPIYAALSSMYRLDSLLKLQSAAKTTS